LQGAGTGQKKARAPKRGVLGVDGITDFNPDANLQITRGTFHKKPEKKKGCC